LPRERGRFDGENSRIFFAGKERFLIFKRKNVILIFFFFFFIVNGKAGVEQCLIHIGGWLAIRR